MNLWSKRAGAALAALLSFLGLLALVCLGGFWKIYGRHPGANTLDYELAKTLLQMGAASVAAAIVGLLAFNYQQRAQADQRELESDRDQRREKLRAKADEAARRADYVDELLRATLTRITASYNGAKRARRQLRALARYKDESDAVRIRAAIYDEWMAKLNDAQLELEAVKRDVSVSRAAYPAADEMFECVKRMEKYLRRLTKEYEKARWKAAADLPLESLDKLADFLARKKDSKRFRPEFVEQYDELRRLVRKNLMNVRFVEFEELPGQDADDDEDEDEGDD